MPSKYTPNCTNYALYMHDWMSGTFSMLHLHPQYPEHLKNLPYASSRRRNGGRSSVVAHNLITRDRMGIKTCVLVNIYMVVSYVLFSRLLLTGSFIKLALSIFWLFVTTCESFSFSEYNNKTHRICTQAPVQVTRRRDTTFLQPGPSCALVALVFLVRRPTRPLAQGPMDEL